MVYLSGGQLTIDYETGELLRFVLDDSCSNCDSDYVTGKGQLCEEHIAYAKAWTNITKFDLQEHLAFWRKHDTAYGLSDGYDILDLGCWDRDATCSEMQPRVYTLTPGCLNIQDFMA